jgi:hypothetical protein
MPAGASLDDVKLTWSTLKDTAGLGNVLVFSSFLHKIIEIHTVLIVNFSSDIRHIIEHDFYHKNKVNL